VLEVAPWFRTILRSKDEKLRQVEVQARLAFALTTLGKIRSDAPDDPLSRVRAVVEHPLTTPFYRALWFAFTHPTLDNAEQTPLMELERVENKHAFEDAFLITHAEVMAGPAAEKLRNHLVALKDSEPRILRRLLLQDMATWDRQHVFGDAATPGIPFLPRRDIYVEPDAVYETGLQSELREPLQKLIGNLLQQHEVVIVRGDFGLGKSMTARLLACQYAKAYLTNRSVPSSQQPFPIFIKCSRDIRPRDQTLNASARWAFFEHARERSISIQDDHAALGLPASSERVIYFVDGLDEVQWSGRDLEDFFRSLKGQTDIRQQAIVFSRKAVVPSEEHRKGMPVVDVQPLTTQSPDGTTGGQVAQWLEKWNALDPEIQRGTKPPINVDQLQKRRLLEICGTPIVLLMVAATWQWAESEGSVTRAQIYERFVLQTARGKYEHDRESHPVVAKAAEELKAHLVEKEEIEGGASPPDAMVWLMARTAWEGQKLAKTGKEMTVRHVANLLADELGIDDEAKAELIKMGLLLVLQTELKTGNHRIGYQHKSFREFLVARYWGSTLWKLTDLSSARADLEARLRGARLFGQEDESFDFLMEMLNAPPWDDSRRTALHRWADVCFHDESPMYGAKDRPSWSKDHAPALREAALAIAGSLRIAGQEPRGIEIRNPEAMRTLVAWSWLDHSHPGLQAPAIGGKGLDFLGAHLSGSNFAYANLEGARLHWANFFHANLLGANLKGASIEEANLEITVLTGANLEGANLLAASLINAILSKATLEGAILFHANLGGANLQGANLEGASLEVANLRGANLEGASLFHANLEGASLEVANLRGANLRGANLQGANLQEANLQEANLKGANLRGANLQGANLQGARLFHANLGGANLQKANLHRTDLKGVFCKRSTLWPVDFDPVAAGAIMLREDEAGGGADLMEESLTPE
jgi:uncharacterized protein YjbI with pentapeptide repeats